MVSGCKGTMKKTLNKLIRKEQGQALIFALIMLAVGSLIVIPLLFFMSTGLTAGQIYEQKMEGLYAADAGVEDALWKIKNDPPASYPYSYQLADINGLTVSVLIEEVDELYGTYIGGGGIHEMWLELNSERVQPPLYDPVEDTYIHEWRLELTNKDNSNVSINSITVSYDNELEYLSGLHDEDVAGLAQGSFESFTTQFTYLTNITMLTWELLPPRPKIDGAPDPDNEIYTTVSCTFQLKGPEDAPGISAYLVAARADVGTVWEYEPFKITAQADDGGTVVSTIEAGVLEGPDSVLVGYWKVD